MGPSAPSLPAPSDAQPHHAPQVGLVGSSGVPPAIDSANALAPLAALCAIARFHQVAADPATLAHQLGLSPTQILNAADLELIRK